MGKPVSAGFQPASSVSGAGRTASKARSRGTTIGVISAVAILGLAAAAYGWIGVSGSGGGNAQIDGSSGKVFVVGPVGVHLVLDQPLAMEGSFVNDNSFTVSVARVNIKIKGISSGSKPCSIALGQNFFTTPAVPPAGERFTVSGSTAAFGSGSGSWSGGVLEFRSSATVNQDGCLGRTLFLEYEAVTG